MSVLKCPSRLSGKDLPDSEQRRPREQLELSFQAPTRMTRGSPCAGTGKRRSALARRIPLSTGRPLKRHFSPGMWRTREFYSLNAILDSSVLITVCYSSVSTLFCLLSQQMGFILRVTCMTALS